MTLISGTGEVSVQTNCASAEEALEALIRAHHSYVTPIFLVLSIAAGAAGYLAWIAGESAGTPGTKDALV